MNEKNFATIEELKIQAIKDGASNYALEWLDKQETLDQVIKEIPDDWRIWCLSRGYLQFAKNCDWKNLAGYNWSLLLCDHPQFSDRCPWEKLNEFDWSNLLIKQPQFKKYKIK